MPYPWAGPPASAVRMKNVGSRSGNASDTSSISLNGTPLTDHVDRQGKPARQAAAATVASMTATPDHQESQFTLRTATARFDELQGRDDPDAGNDPAAAARGATRRSNASPWAS